MIIQNVAIQIVFKMADMCYFFESCKNTRDPLTDATAKRIRNIIESSKVCDDDLHISLQEQLDSDENFKIKCHRNCVSSYTSPDHIARRKCKLSVPAERSQSEPPLT